MELQGKIIQILPTSTYNGRNGTITIYSFVLECGDQYSNKIKFDVFGDDKWANMNVQEGQVAKVSFDVKSKDYNGRWYTDCTAWRVEQVIDNATMGKPIQQRPAAPAPTTTQQPQQVDNAFNGDDLPF